MHKKALPERIQAEWVIGRDGLLIRYHAQRRALIAHPAPVHLPDEKNALRCVTTLFKVGNFSGGEFNPFQPTIGFARIAALF